MKDSKYNNILILEAGGPCGVACIKLLRKLKGVRIIAADMDSYASGFQMSDVSYVIPPASSDKFSESINKIISISNVDAIFPCFEFGYEKLIKLEGNFLIDLNNAIRLKDKLEFDRICGSNGLITPNTSLFSIESRPKKYPVYIKPRFGVGSKDNYVVRSDDQLYAVSKLIPKNTDFLVQTFIEGDHWNVDVLVDNGTFLAAVPRKDIMQKAGNPFTVEVRNYQKLIEFSRKVQSMLNIKYPFNLEVFETETNNFVMGEINTRFGNGVVFSALAGVDMVSYLATKDSSFLGEISEGVYTRYLEEIKVDPSKVKYLK